MIAIAADSVAETAALQQKLPALTLLTDTELAASTAWGVHEQGAENPSPGTFVVGKDGVIAWRRLENSGGDWPTYAELSAALH